MITETAFVGCENIPPAMVGRFDEHWRFVGEPATNDHFVACICQKCSESDLSFKPSSGRVEYKSAIFWLEGFLFVTDEMLEVMVYFGACQDCGAVHWARSGPPFRRVRARIHSTA